MASHSPKLLNERQRKELTSIPDNLSSRDIAHHYTLLPEDLALINEQHGQTNRLGFAVQLCVLRFPGRTMVDLPGIPGNVLDYIAKQLNIAPEQFVPYGERSATISDHLNKLRQRLGYRDYAWSEMLQLARRLLPLAMEIDLRAPLVEAALEHLRQMRVIAPAIGSIEALVWQVMRIARRRIYRRLGQVLTPTQRELLDGCLQSEPGLRKKTRLHWLRVGPKNISKESLNHLVERVKYLKLLQLPRLPLHVHPHRVRLLARRCKQYSPSLLKSMKRKNPHRYYATLLAYLTEFAKDEIDQTVDMFDGLIEDMLRRADRAQEQHLKAHARAMHENVMTLTDAAEAFLKAHDEQLEPFATVFSVVSKVKLKATIQSVRQLARPRDLDVVDLMEKRYIAKRKAFLHFYQSLLFQPALESHPALTALDHIVMLKDLGNYRVKRLQMRIGKHTWRAPLEFLQHTRWLKHALVDEKKVNPNFYEAGAFDRLRHGLRSGDIAVVGSRRFQDFNSYLLSVADFRRLREQGLTRLALTGSAQEYVTTMQPRIATGFADIERSLPTNTALSVDAEGKMHLSSLEGAVTPPMRAFRRYWYQWLPHVQLTDLLLEVDAWTGFLDRLVHHTSHRPATGEEKLALVTALVALATNLGLEKMAQASPFSQYQLDKAVDGHIREETLLAGQGILDSFMLRLPISRLWGDGTFSSSDGIRFSMGVNAPNAVYNSRYFGTRRGVTVITHLADIGVPIGKQPVISTNDREALYVIDALCHHDTELNLDTHTTDTGGSTYHVFDLCALLGYHFVPHLRSLTEQYLFSAEAMAVPAPFADLFQGPIDLALLERNWEDLLRVATSIRHGVVPASLIMRKLRSYSRQNELSRALNELGKLERTAFILDYLLDETLRRRVRVALNRGESLHALARALFFGQLGQFHDRDLQDQMHRASALMLLIAAISVWNAVYLQKALDAMRAANVVIEEEYLRHTFPLGWSHINFFGKYDFDLGQTYSLQYLRSLRPRPNVDPMAA